MNYEVLVPELSNDPLERGYDSMSDTEVADDLNAKTRRRTVSILSAELLAWSGQAGRLGRIEAAANDDALPDEVRTVAKVALRLIERDSTELDLKLPDRRAMLDAMVDAGVLTDEDRASLVSLATQAISRAEELGIESVTSGHIESARHRMGGL